MIGVLKTALSKTPVLSLPNFTKPFVVDLDASYQAIGAFLLQLYEGRLYPVVYCSKKNLPDERNYPAIEKIYKQSSNNLIS